MAFASVVYLQEQESGWYLIVYTTLHAGLLLMLFVPARLCGWQLATAEARSDVSSPKTQLRLGDLFLILLVVSLFFAAARVMLSRIGPMSSYWIDWLDVSVAVAVSAIVMWVTLQRSRWLFGLGACLSLAGFAFLVSEPIQRLTYGHVAQVFRHDSIDTRVLLTTAVSLFVFLAAYRLRGNRLSRQSSLNVARLSQTRA
jgi:hypothetical protein